MKKKSGRRTFIKNIGAVGLSTAAISHNLIAGPGNPESATSQGGNSKINQQNQRKYNGPYSGEFLDRVAFPIGGMGAGMFCLEGSGAISHMSVRHKPDLWNDPGTFAAIAVKGIPNGAKVVEGPVPDWKKFGLRGAGNGLGGTTYGLPRFHRAEFVTRFPFATITMEDEDLPLRVELTGWNPFIPTDPDNSSLPAGCLEYKFINTGNDGLEVIFSYNARNFMKVDDGTNSIGRFDHGFVLSEKGTKEKPVLKGDFAIYTDQPGTVVDHCWFRGGWFDPMTIAWNTIKNFRTASVEPVESGAPGASLYVPFSLAPNGEKTIRLMMAWYVPESEIHVGKDAENGGLECVPANGCSNNPVEAGLAADEEDYAFSSYKPWYSKRFDGVSFVANYFSDRYEDLRKRSNLFSNAYYSSTLPAEVMEAVAANLTILKSPTVMRQYDGRMWNYEGCGDDWGCCHGSCTHVWNYAQAVSHLFPSLERSLRHTEFCEDQNVEGHQTFRAALPIRPVDHGFYSAADGQLGGIMKVYREWRIGGDNDWLKKIFPMVKVSMDYCIRTWDPRSHGVVEEPHHNTYDIEFWGPDGMCTSFYLGALHAMIEMGDFLKENTSEYKKLLKKGKKFMERELFDGEYFFQKIQYTGLNAANPIDASAKSMGGNYSDEARALLEKEGPKYQYGTGCLSDGVLGAWISSMCGLESPIDAGKIKSHVKAVYKYNFKKNLSDHANPQRPSFALGEEGGLLLCSWPKGGQLSLPFVYSDEVWTGIEYQVASHLMLMGLVDEGLEIVRACRDRYDGRIRNPFNEYECGSWYARAMSSYGMIQGLTGVRYDAVDKCLYIDSKIGDFTSFLSTETGFGTVTLNNNKPSMKIYYGTIPVEKVVVSGQASSLN